MLHCIVCLFVMHTTKGLVLVTSVIVGVVASLIVLLMASIIAPQIQTF